jgi:hypothetical protein
VGNPESVEMLADVKAQLLSDKPDCSVNFWGSLLIFLEKSAPEPRT